MNQFETIITSIRNILRIEGITGLDSINHCIAFIISRYLTIEKCIEFDIPLEFAFENFIRNEDGSLIDDQTAIGKFYNQNAEIDCLFVYLRSRLNFNSFNFKINTPLNFLKIYKKLSDININSLSNNIDIVGAIYELHLKTGTTGSGMRDLGQYFTNREVIKYMIELCNPKLKSNGEIETILDPSMGTGGFLSMSIKYLNKNHQNINWNINKDKIYGFDIDETVKNLSVLNALLECGKIFNRTLVKNDTLHNDYKISDNVLIEKVDIILANEPFGLKNIIYNNVCSRIKNLNIDGTKAEPLFLQLMMQSLNHNGRCAVIVPDGVLFNDAKLYKLTRKYLCSNLRLSKVISLEDGLFLNTGVKSSILFFVNDGNTSDVEFNKIKMYNGEIIEELIIKVNIDKIIENDYSLFVNKYNTVEEEKIKGLKYMRLDELFSFESSKLNSGDMDNNGEFNFYSGIALNPAGKHSSFNFNIEEYIGIIKGGGAGAGKYGDQIGLGKVFYLTGKNAISNGMYILKPKVTNNNLKYIYYYLKISKNKIMDMATYTTGLGNIKQENLKSLEIPIPFLSIQEQIVEALDIIYDTIESNNKLIKNYEKIKKSIIYFNTFNTNKQKLSDICNFLSKSKRQASFGNETGKYKFFTSSLISKFCDEADYIDEHIIIGDGGVANINIGSNFSCSDHNYILKSKQSNILNKYIYYYLFKNLHIIENGFKGSTLKNVAKSYILDIQIPIPSLAIQEQIIKECEYYDNLIKILLDENNNLLNNNIIKLTFDSIQSNHEHLEEIELENEDSL